MSGRNSLRASDPGFGVSCPNCGRRKHVAARRCVTCYREDVEANSLERDEAIVTFKNDETDAVRTLVCPGRSSVEQVAYGRRRLGTGWRVLSRSTPRSILSDLRRRPE